MATVPTQVRIDENLKKQVSTLAEASQIEVLFASTHLFFIYVLLHIPFSLTIINIFLMHQKSRIRCTGILNLSSYPAFVPLNSSPFDARIYI